MIHLDDVRRDLGGRTLFSEATCRIGQGERIGLVGANGAGKTTLLRLLQEIDQPDGGRIIRRKDLRVGTLPQEVGSLPEVSILEIVLEGGGVAQKLAQRIEDIETRLANGTGDVSDEEAGSLGELHEDLDAMGGYDLDSRARRILKGLGFEDSDCERNITNFSGGWMMRVALARLLLSSPDLLLLDEPTNHLDLPSLEWLEGYLQGHRGALIIVSHDQTFLDRSVNVIFEMSRGTLTRYVGNYSAFVEEKRTRDEHQTKSYAQQQKYIVEQKRFIERFRYKASKAAQVQSRVKALEKLELIQQPEGERSVRGFAFRKMPETGRVVCELKDLDAGYGDHVVLRNVNLEVQRGDRIALVGRNGEGKTTLSRILAGSLEPLAGTRELGLRASCAYFGQHQVTELDLKESVYESAASCSEGENIGVVRGALGAFLFDSDDMEKEVGVLSGGEKNRLALARMLLKPAPFLVLDEPTNHLDMASRRALEAALEAFPGTIVLVSHDRSFLNALAGVVIEVTAGGISRYEGNYDDYVYQRERRLAAQAEDEARRSGHSGSTTSAPSGKKPTGKKSTGKPAEPAKRVLTKDQRKAARERLRPLRKDAARLEQSVNELEARLKVIDEKLSDPEFYEGELGVDTLKERIEVAHDLESRTERWYAAQEALEAAEAEGA